MEREKVASEERRTKVALVRSNWRKEALSDKLVVTEWELAKKGRARRHTRTRQDDIGLLREELEATKLSLF